MLLIKWKFQKALHDFDAQSKIDVLKMFLMIIRLKNFHYSLNFVVIFVLNLNFSLVNVPNFCKHLRNEINRRIILPQELL